MTTTDRTDLPELERQYERTYAAAVECEELCDRWAGEPCGVRYTRQRELLIGDMAEIEQRILQAPCDTARDALVKVRRLGAITKGNLQAERLLASVAAYLERKTRV